MAETSTLPPKGKGTIGGIKKEYVYAGGAVLVVVIGVVYFRSKQQSQQAGQNVTDPAGNVCPALDPNSGYCPGSPEDAAYQGTGGITPGALVGSDSSSFVSGQIIGYDQFGNPIYSSNSGVGNTGPGTYTNNAAWSQAAQAYLVDNDPNANPATIAAALGAYINGQPVTPAQRSIIEQAIAFELPPPVAGTGGFPPNIVDAPVPPPTGGGGGGGTGGPPKKGGAKNPVTGLHAIPNFTNFDLSWHAAKDATNYIVTTTKAGKQINKQTVTGTHTTIGHLQKGTRYFVRVWATPDNSHLTPAGVTVTTKK